MLRTFSDNPTCKHIIFGGCHDAGYLVNLDQYKHNETKASRMTLLESTAPARGYADLPNFKRARFDSVFRSEALPPAEYMPAAYKAPSPPPAPVQISVRPVAHTKMQSPVASPSPVNVKPAQAALPPNTTSSSLATPSSAASSNSWATVGKAGVSNGNISIAPATKTSAKKRYLYFNKDGYRLDEALSPRDKNAAEAIERRMEKVSHNGPVTSNDSTNKIQTGRNLCNHWHLNRGKCTNGSFCKFQHEPKLSPAELNALKYKTRSLPCKRRDCDNFDCCK
jgi:hypothetical protein